MYQYSIYINVLRNTKSYDSLDNINNINYMNWIIGYNVIKKIHAVVDMSFILTVVLHIKK